MHHCNQNLARFYLQPIEHLVRVRLTKGGAPQGALLQQVFEALRLRQAVLRERLPVRLRVPHVLQRLSPGSVIALRPGATMPGLQACLVADVLRQDEGMGISTAL